MDLESARDRHRKLVGQGWTRRFTAEEPRLSEMKESYESLGLEVTLETTIPDDGRECTVCLGLPGFADKCKTIYTRDRAGGGSDKGDDLFE